jgi:exodeoxyribonuclease VII small subunit
MVFMAKEQDPKELTFEQAYAKAEAIAQAIEQGKIGLQESVQQYETGMKLIARCYEILREAEQRVQRIQLLGNQLKTEPFTPEEQDDSSA